MNPNGQVIVESALILLILVFMAIGAVAILHSLRREMKHESTSDRNFSDGQFLHHLQSLGLVTFESYSTEDNINTLESQDWIIDKKLRDPKGRPIYLMRKGDQGVLINRNIGVKVCLKNC